MRDSTIDYVAVKNPLGTIIWKRKDGSVHIRVEMTQEQLNATIEKAFSSLKSRRSLSSVPPAESRETQKQQP